MAQDWKKDPRLKTMDPQKIKMLEEFSSRIEKADRSQMVQLFTQLNEEARNKGLSFNQQETGLIISILTSGMPPAARKQAELLRLMWKKRTP